MTDMPEYFDIISRLEKLHLLRRIILQHSTAGLELHMGQLPILEYIRQHGGCTQVELAENLMVSPASIALSTKRMKREGLLEKKADETNLRRNQLTITPKGIELSKRCRSIFDEFDQRIFRGFSSAELVQLRDTLDKMLGNITDTPAEELDIFALKKFLDRTANGKMVQKEKNE